MPSGKRGHQIEEKTINCSVHGAMAFSPLAMAIIDTLEFQRLRRIAQVGIVEFVYPSARHSRFEHCLGTAHLGRLFISEIARCQPELKVTEREIRCVELAGLCHDLGHGPFSHLWERFYRLASEEIYGIKDAEWQHENTSVQILRHLLSCNRILERFPNQIDEADVDMIENMILGRVPAGSGRRFLYQIISNPDSGLDVDKWDYFMRDAQHLGVKIDFEYQHVLRGLKVLEYDGELHACFRDKCYDIIQQGFENRFKLHKKAYQHKKIRVMEHMLLQALLQLERAKVLPMWQTTRAIACERPSSAALSAFIALADTEVTIALLNHSAIYRAMLSRSTNPLTYRYVGTLPHSAEVRDMFLATLPAYNLQPADVALLDVVLHMGKNDVNPMKHVLFFTKDSSRPEYLPCDERYLTAERSFVVALKCSDSEKQRNLGAAVRAFEASAGASERQRVRSDGATARPHSPKDTTANLMRMTRP
ncbi:sam/hd domain protein-like [Tropilaelaps mercedesae]|uniref:Sam/hd domain protein-like n=1 Tax=Tropilaelaps mercedesae TaxID=418985 RepID=A0A1V9XW69_9ACAR|nr:sam/hd domain protein-like [Tropilaelaps mercedesae]